MENQKLLKNLNSKGRLLALLLTLTAGLLYCSSAWAAQEGGFDGDNNKGVSIVLQKNSDSAVTMLKTNNGSGEMGHSFGSVTTLKITGITAYAYQTGDGDGNAYYNLCGTKLFWAIKNETSGNVGSWEGYNLDQVEWGSWDKNWRHPKYYKSGIGKSVIGDLGAGSYSIQMYFEMTGGPGNDNCNDKKYYKDGENNIYATFTIPGWSTTSKTYTYAGTTKVGVGNTQTITLSTHYGSNTGIKSVSKSGDNEDDFTYVPSGSTTSSIKVTFTPSGTGLRTAVLTITDNYDKTYELTVKGTGISNTTPTVLIGAKEQIEAQDVTLFGYVKYTGCKDINKVGFIISQTESEVTGGTAQVYEGTATADPIEAGTDFSFSSDEFENETYYYRAWMKASDNTIALSDEVRTFEPQGVCNAKSASAILPIFKSGKTTESATFTEGSASIDLTVEKNCIADVYQWNVESQPDGGNATFSTGNKRNTTVTVEKVGTYEFTLFAKCTDDAQLIESSRVLTLYVCEPAETTQLYLDNHTDNVLCVGEKATATCITKVGYAYSLYSPSGDNLGTLAGTGGTQTWRNVTGAGEFTMRTSPTSMPQCAAVVSSATQRYNEPTMEITADPGLSVLSYQPVTLSKKAGEAETYVDTDPTWVITDGSDKAYLLNEHNRLAYDNRARKSVVFKAGAGVATQITVEASAYKTVEVDDPDPKVENYTKQCPATAEVTLTVSPAVDDCLQP